VAEPARAKRRAAHLAGQVLAAALILLCGAVAPAQAAGRPAVVARAAILVDARDGHVLYRRDPTEERPIASATKLMTALVALDELPLGRELRAVPYNPAPAESRINLRAGERMSVADLIRALLLESANDAAETLAVRAGGSVRRFVDLMNERAQGLGLAHTWFANPVGLDAPGAQSTALDLSRLARRMLRSDFLAATVDMPRARLLSGARPRIVANRNRLVREVGWVDGVKTGHTAGAGYVLVGSGTRKGARLVSVVLGAPSEAARDADTLALLRYGLAQYRRVRPVPAGATVATARVEHFGDRDVRLIPARPIAVTVRRGQRLRTVLRAPGEVTGPLRARARVGSVIVYRDGRRVRSVPLVTAAAVPEAGLLRKAWSVLWSPIVVLAAGIAAWLILRRRRRTLASRHPSAPARERAG
jgi:serine-type D-Ala-D-Ala carboxypeptidase (penicillin-binding protein 5/6)